MLSKLQQLRGSREEGFTLVELLVVIVIIGVLAAIAVPLYVNQQRAAIKATIKADTRTIVVEIQTMLVKNPTAVDQVITNEPLPTDTPAQLDVKLANAPFARAVARVTPRLSPNNISLLTSSQTWNRTKTPNQMVSYTTGGNGANNTGANYQNWGVIVINEQDLIDGWGYSYESKTGKFGEFVFFY